jgi:hypothetical protein
MSITNALLSNGTVVPSVVITGGVVTTPASGLPGDTIVSGLINSGSFNAPYPQCNDFTQSTTDPLCLFARNNCSQYYDGNYPIAGKYVVYGTVPTPGETVLTPTCSFDPDMCIFFNDSRCICADCRPSIANFNASCLHFYDPITGWPLDDYQLPTLCPYVSSNPINESMFVNVTPPACEFLISKCMNFLTEFNTTFDDRCNCTTLTSLTTPTVPHTGAINFTFIVDSVLLNNTACIPGPKIPHVVVTSKLQLSQFNCVTNLWKACDCVPYYFPDSTVTVCIPNSHGNCTTQTLTVSKCLSTPNCTLPPPPATFSFYYNSTVPLTCNTATDSVGCDCGAYLIGQVCPPPVGSATYDIEGFPSTALLQIIGNSACYHWNALLYKQVTDANVRPISVNPQIWYEMALINSHSTGLMSIRCYVTLKHKTIYS